MDAVVGVILPRRTPPERRCSRNSETLHHRACDERSGRFAVCASSACRPGGTRMTVRPWPPFTPLRADNSPTAYVITGSRTTRTFAGVAVGCVRRVQLIGTANPTDRLTPRDCVVDFECRVSRDAKAIGDRVFPGSASLRSSIEGRWRRARPGARATAKWRKPFGSSGLGANG